MSRRRVLAISRNLDQLRRIVANLERAGAEVDAVRTPDAIQSEIIPHRYIFYAVDEGDFDTIERALPKLRKKAHTAIVVPRAKLEDLTVFLKDQRVNHVIVGEELDRGVFVTAQKLLTGDIFGIEKYLPEGTPVHYVRLRDFQGRGKALDTVLDFAAQSRMRRQVRNAIGQVCEELLMNALYDAPVDEHGQQIFAEVDPRDRTKSRSPKPVSIRYAATESQFAVAVRDRFGRLAKNTILSYIDKCLYSPNADRSQDLRGRAGFVPGRQRGGELYRQRGLRHRYRGGVYIRSRRQGSAQIGRCVRPSGQRRNAARRPDTRDRTCDRQAPGGQR